jgi:hypothetical protein
MVLANRLGWPEVDMSEAKAHFQTAIALRPGLAASYLNLIRLHLKQGEPNRARKVLAGLDGDSKEKVEGRFYPDAQRAEWKMACVVARVLEFRLESDVGTNTDGESR